MPHSPADGILAERKAAEYLEQKGYRILGKNVNYPRIGELDIVCEDRGTIVFVEVRYRKDKELGDPLDSITKPKMRKLIKAASMYLAGNRLEDMPARFDVVSVTDLGIGHIENAFYGDFI